MIPSSQSVQNLQTTNLHVAPPPRSSSSINLAAAAGASATSRATHATSGTPTGPAFARSYSASPAPSASYQNSSSRPYTADPGQHRGYDFPRSPQLTAQHQQSHQILQQSLPQPKASRGGPSFSQSTPPPHTPGGNAANSGSHFANYDAKLVLQTINRMDSSSFATAPGNTTNSSSSAQNPDHDAWTTACIRTLPLFNGEGQRGYIEDLNDLVSLHVKRTIDRMGMNSSVLSALTSDLVDLLAMGMLTLNAKLLDLSDDRLLVRITEVWNFYFIGCLPYIEGIFLPLRTHDSLRKLVSTSSRQTTGRSQSFGSQSYRTIEAIDIRKIALRSFRDHLVLPIVDRLAMLFSIEQSPRAAHPAEPTSQPNTTINIGSTAKTAFARRLQMVSILVSVQSNDERQAATEALGKALEAGLESRPEYYGTASGQNSPFTKRGYTTSRGRTSREAEKKAWRRGRQVIHSSTRPGSVGQGRNATPQHDGDQTNRDSIHVEHQRTQQQPYALDQTAASDSNDQQKVVLSDWPTRNQRK